MILHTNRLSIVPFCAADLQVFHSLNTNSFIRRYLWDDRKISMSLSGEILEESIQKFRQQKWGLWKIVLRGKIIGYTGLWRFFNEEQPQLIFALLPDYTKQGYATESARCIVNYAFNVLDYEYLVAALDTENLDSAKVCRNLGMHLSSERKIDGKPTSFFTLKRLDAKTEKH